MARVETAERNLAAAETEVQRQRTTIMKKDRKHANLLDQHAQLQKSFKALLAEQGALQKAHAVLQRDSRTAVRAANVRASTAEAESVKVAQASRASAAASAMQFPVASQVRCHHGAA